MLNILADSKTSTTMLAATTGQTAAVAPKKSRTGLYVVLLLFLLGLLALVLYLLGRQTGVIGNDTSGTVAVPNLIGLDSTAAQAQLQQKGLTFTMMANADRVGTHVRRRLGS